MRPLLQVRALARRRASQSPSESNLKKACRDERGVSRAVAHA